MGTVIEIYPPYATKNYVVLVLYLLSFIPELYLSLRFLFISYYIVDTKEGIIDAFKKSFALSQLSGTLVFLVLFMFLARMLLPAFASTLLIVIFELSVTYFYRKLSKNFIN